MLACKMPLLVHPKQQLTQSRFSDRDTAMRFIGGAIGHQTVPVQHKLTAELLPEDSGSDSGDEGSVVEMEDFEESTEADIELEEEDADHNDDNLDE